MLARESKQPIDELKHYKVRVNLLIVANHGGVITTEQSSETIWNSAPEEYEKISRKKHAELRTTGWSQT